MSLELDPRLIDALLTWQAELGADEYISDLPVDRFAEAAAEAERRAAAQISQSSAPREAPRAPNGRPAPPPPPPEKPKVDAVADSRKSARAVESLEALAEAMAAYPHCELKKGARNLVFADGHADAKVMVIGDAPRIDEDRQGRPFAGRGGALLDLMLHAIGLDRESPDPDRAVYLTPVLPWRPPGNRDPEAAELEMMLPFLKRHIELVDPKVLIVMGNQASQALLGQAGITRLRGEWTEVMNRPALPMLHSDYLLRNPAAKRQAWADLLSLKARLREL